MSTSFLEEVTNYLTTRGWEVSSTQVRTGTYIVAGKRDDGTRSLTMVVTATDGQVTPEHLKYLLKAAREKDVEEAALTAEADIDEEIRTKANERGVDILDKEQIRAANTGFDVALDDISVAEDASQTDRSVDEEEHDDGGRFITRRRAILAGAGLFGGAIWLGNLGEEDGTTANGNKNSSDGGDNSSPSVAEIKRQASEVKYGTLLRNSDQYEGKYVHFPRAKIIQVLGDEDSGFQFRTYVTETEFAWENDVLLRWDGERFLTDDIVEVWGVSNGLVTYETVLGNERTIPDITVRAIEKRGEQTDPTKLSWGAEYTTFAGYRIRVDKPTLQDTYTYEDFQGETVEREAKNGKQWVFVNVWVKNETGETSYSPLASDFKLLVGDTQYESVILTYDPVNRTDRFNGGELQPNTERSGWIAYQVPADTSISDMTIAFTEANKDRTAHWTTR